MSDVLGRLAEDGGLVELVRWCETAEILVGVLLHVLGAGLLETVDHDAQSGDGVAKGGDLVVEVSAVSLLDHVVGCLLGRRAVATCRGRRRGG